MKKTTLCYLERGGCYLMLHRIKKKNDLNHDKWIGVGGKFEKGETADDCLRREVWEETGLWLTRCRLRGIVTFLSERWEAEEMYLYTADGFEGTLSECSEGKLEWVPIEKLAALPMWEGDRLFFRKIAENAPPFRMTLSYDAEDRLLSADCGELQDPVT